MNTKNFLIVMKTSKNYFSFIYSWYWPTNEDLCKEAEYNLLIEKFPTLNEETQDENFKINLEQIEINDNVINTFSIKNVDAKKNLLITHGFGVGLAIFYQNFKQIAKQNRDYNIYAIDWLGMGRSGRPEFKVKLKKNQTKEEHVKEVI